MWPVGQMSLDDAPVLLFKKQKMKKRTFLYFAMLSAVLVSCKQHYELTAVERSRILIDKRYDANADAEVQAFMVPYKAEVDKEVAPVVGRSAEYLWAEKPESNLSNLLTDILVWAGKLYNEQPDFAVYNIGGMRAAFPKGDITKGDVLEVAPFENKICFATLTGAKVLELFSQMAARGGDGVSREVRVVAARGGQVETATIKGQPVDPQASYRIATIDYVAQGNDGMVAFKDKTDVVAPTENKDNLRFIIEGYLRELTSQGKEADAKVEGRFIIKD